MYFQNVLKMPTRREGMETVVFKFNRQMRHIFLMYMLY